MDEVTRTPFRDSLTDDQAAARAINRFVTADGGLMPRSVVEEAAFDTESVRAAVLRIYDRKEGVAPVDQYSLSATHLVDLINVLRNSNARFALNPDAVMLGVPPAVRATAEAQLVSGASHYDGFGTLIAHFFYLGDKQWFALIMKNMRTTLDMVYVTDAKKVDAICS